MFRSTGDRRRVGALCGLLAAAALAGALPAASAQVAVACAGSTTSTLAAIDAMVANNIYRGELGGTETQTDLGHITTAPDLIAAVGADNVAATAKAVARIVYHHFWHIVRLRVYDAAGRLLADVGGPYVIAPVDGVLRSPTGAQIGTFVMSVQDDVGFTKLESRALGDPIAIYVGGARVAQLGAAFPRAEPSGPSLALGGVRYASTALTYDAFPTGTLDAVIAVPAPAAALAVESCSAVDVSEIGRVAERLALRFHPLAANYPNFVQVVNSETGAVVVVRIGQRVIAGSGGPGPIVLPSHGTVSYEDRLWSVFTFAPTPPARVYLLIAPPA